MKYNIEAIQKRNNIKKMIFSILKKMIFILVILLIYNIFLVVTSALNQNERKEIFGYKAYIITTESMKPNINEGDVILITSCDENKISVGNIITFKNKSQVVTHRVIDIKEENGKKAFITKGDNNNVEDYETIYYDQIDGMHICTIPFLGTLIMAFKNKIFAAIVIVAIILIYLYTKNMEEKRKMRREKKKVEDEKFKDKDSM